MNVGFFLKNSKASRVSLPARAFFVVLLLHQLFVVDGLLEKNHADRRNSRSKEGADPVDNEKKMSALMEEDEATTGELMKNTSTNLSPEEVEQDVYLGRTELKPETVEIDLELNDELADIAAGAKGNSVTTETKKGPGDYRSTTMEELLDKLHGNNRNLRSHFSTFREYDNDRELLSLNPSEAATIGDALIATNNGDLELGLDILASTVVAGVCVAVSWALAGPTMGVSGAAAPLVCAAAAFWSGIIFSTFDWLGGIFGTPSNDDAWWTVEAGRGNYADGNSLGISYHRGKETDKDSLGHINRGEIKESREDLDAQHLVAIEVRVEDTNDVCVKNMAFQVGKEPSGTGKVEKVAVAAPVFTYITKTKLHDSQEMCIYFGDEEGAIGNFKFHWRSALKCQRNFGTYLTLDYAKCLTWAMYSYDVRKNGKYSRYTYTNSPSLPSYYNEPMHMVKSRAGKSWHNKELCMDLANYKTDNYTPITLVDCKNNDAQRFDFDNDGRLRSKVDPTKCVEAGKDGTLYRKLFIYDCHGGEWQQWTRYSSGRIKNKYHGKYIGLAYCKADFGRPLELRWYEDGVCGEAQKWSW
mmetsp:Transcript_25394/g.36883  ORF Transcript_25394/g.36883 Transcript_25394/m.36883 type:complete len:583 (-) Transcript_25394:244-1992(-)